MNKYGDQDVQHLEDQLERERQQRPDGEKTAAEEKLTTEIERLKNGRQEEP